MRPLASVRVLRGHDPARSSQWPGVQITPSNQLPVAFFKLYNKNLLTRARGPIIPALSVAVGARAAIQRGFYPAG